MATLLYVHHILMGYEAEASKVVIVIAQSAQEQLCYNTIVAVIIVSNITVIAVACAIETIV